MRRSRGPPNSLDPYTAGRTLLRIASPRIHLGIVPITTPSSIFPTSSSDDHTERESDHFRYGVEAVASYCCPPESGGQDYHSADFATYNRPVNIADTNEEMWGLSRYLHLGHLDEVVRSWDEEAVGKVVEMLGLDIVKASRWVREGEETRPMLVCFQSLGVGNERDDIWESINRG